MQFKSNLKTIWRNFFHVAINFPVSSYFEGRYCVKWEGKALNKIKRKLEKKKEIKMKIGSEWEGGSQQGISFVCINSFISHTTFLPPNPIDMTGIKKFVFELKGNWCVNRLKWEWKWKKFLIFFSLFYTSGICWVDERKRVEKKILNDWKISKNICQLCGHGMEDLFLFFLRRVGEKYWERKKLMKTWSHAVRRISSWKLYKHGQSVCGRMENWYGLR